MFFDNVVPRATISDFVVYPDKLAAKVYEPEATRVNE